MKKILFVALVCTLVSCDSCSKQDYAIQYAFEATGNATGDFNVSFPQGSFSSNGDVVLAFNIASLDTVNLKAVPLEQLRSSNDKETLEALNRIEEGLNEIKFSSASGTYLVHLKGYAKEPITGIVVSIDKTYGNNPELQD